MTKDDEDTQAEVCGDCIKECLRCGDSPVTGVAAQICWQCLAEADEKCPRCKKNKVHSLFHGPANLCHDCARRLQWNRCAICGKGVYHEWAVGVFWILQEDIQNKPVIASPIWLFSVAVTLPWCHLGESQSVTGPWNYDGNCSLWDLWTSKEQMQVAYTSCCNQNRGKEWSAYQSSRSHQRTRVQVLS